MSIPQNWRIRQQRYALAGEACQNCHSKVFPPREICPVCGTPMHMQLAFTDLFPIQQDVRREAVFIPVQRV